MNRPPRRRCPGCGRNFRTWREGDACATCKRATRGDAAALTELLRAGRYGRQLELGGEQPVEPPRRTAYGELPDDF